jgi:hypothetical protein
VALAAHTKVLEGRVNCLYLFLRQRPALAAADDNAENVEKVLDPAMAVLEHPERIIESTIGFCANLYAQLYSSKLIIIDFLT